MAADTQITAECARLLDLIREKCPGVLPGAPLPSGVVGAAIFESEIGHDLLQRLRFAAEILHLVGGRGTSRVAVVALAGLQELFRPAIGHRRGDALAPSLAMLSSPRSPSSTTRIFFFS